MLGTCGMSPESNVRNLVSPTSRTSLSTAALVATLTYEVFFLPVWVLQSWKYRVEGLVRPDTYAQPSPGLQPIVVRVAPGPDGHPDPYVNWQPVTWENLASVLRKELSQRPPDWPAYVEADPNVEWKDAASAIDAVRGLPAKSFCCHGRNAHPCGLTPEQAATQAFSLPFWRILRTILAFSYVSR